MSRRCAQHDLALGPDARCVICRREQPALDHAGNSRVVSGLGWFVAITLTIGGAIALPRALRRDASPLGQPSQLDLVSTAHEGTTASQVPAPPTKRDPTTRASTNGTKPTEPPLPRARTEPTQPTAMAASGPMATNASVTAAAAATARVPTALELKRAMRATPITLYATSWCPACKQARSFLNQQGFSFSEIDVEAQPSGWAQVASLAGRKSVPVIVVDGTTLSGFNPDKIMVCASKSVERRLGVTGLRVERK